MQRIACVWVVVTLLTSWLSGIPYSPVPGTQCLPFFPFTDTTTDGERTVTSEAELQQAFANLRHSSIVILKANRIELSTTLIADGVQNVTLLGLSGGTTLICPRNSSILIVMDASIRLERLRFKGCYGSHSAVSIQGNRPILNVASSQITERSCNVVISESFFEDNERNGHNREVWDKGGAAVVVSNCRLVVNKSQFVGNIAAQNGSCIAAMDSVTIVEDVVFSENVAGASGGAMYMLDGELSLRNVSFTSNRAKLDGGGLCMETSDTGCLRRYDIASQNAVFSVDKEASSTDNTTRTNLLDATDSASGDEDDGLEVNGNESFMQIVAQNSGASTSVSKMNALVAGVRFEGNSAGRHGGAIHARHAECAVKDMDCARNSALHRGGCFHALCSAVTVENSSLSGNAARLTGGGADAEFSHLTARNVSFLSNKAEKFGAGFASRKGMLKLINSTLATNTVAKSGGGVYLRRTISEFDDVAFVANRAVKGSGGAALVQGRRCLLTSTVFTNNSATGRGGSIDAQDTKLVIEDANFISGRSDDDGGAIHVHSCTVVIRNAAFIDNRCRRYAGAVLGRNTQLTMEYVAFTENHADLNGGALHAFGNTTILKNVVFTANTANEAGGAIQFRDGNYKLENITINANTAVNGGGVHLVRSNVSISHGDFLNNTVNGRAGAFYARASTLELRHVRFSENAAIDSGGAISIDEGNTWIFNGTFSDNKSVRYGGAILCGNGTFFLHHVFFVKNWAGRSAGAVHIYNNDAVLKNVNFTSNEARENGGAIQVRDGNYTLEQTHFLSNVAHVGGGAHFTRCTASISFSQFIVNRAEDCGGGVSVDDTSMKVNHTTFLRNRASRGGAGVLVKNAETLITFSTFTGNRVSKGKGGGLSIRDSSSDIEFSNFTNNAAVDGGAINIEHVDLGMNACAFVTNLAKRIGGAVSASREGSLVTSNVTYDSNRAKRGGGLSLAKGIRHRTRTSSGLTIYRNNSAVFGGGLYCDSCSSINLSETTFFWSNVANKHGGGAYVSKVEKTSAIRRFCFRENVAHFGGALFIVDCRSFVLGPVEHSESAYFERNTATAAGGLWLESTLQKQPFYILRNCRFLANRAVPATVVERSFNLASKPWNTSFSDERWAFDKLPLRWEATGGGFYLKLHIPTDSTNTSIRMQRITSELNTATIGGGGYIEGIWQSFRNFSATNSTISKAMSRSFKQRFKFRDMRIANNTASRVAGGLFIKGLPDKAAICRNQTTDSHTGGEISLVTECIEVVNNQIEDKETGYGPDVATDAVSLQLLNFNGSLSGLRSGDVLGDPISSKAAHCYGVQFGIHIAIIDAFEQIIKGGIPDAELVLDVNSSAITGQRVYRSHAGEACLSNTQVTGIQKTGPVTIHTIDDREVPLTVSFNFTTMPCMNGELMDEERSRCVRCDHFNEYTFESKATCRYCEDHAVCVGTTVLVPKDGFWHSTPFSPFVRRCLLKNACTWPRRTEQLMRFYNNSDFIRAELETFSLLIVEEWKPYSWSGFSQCATGYEGLLCGSCSSGYGRSANGECKRCELSRSWSIVMAASVTLLMFIILAIKLALEVDSVVSVTGVHLQREVISFIEPPTEDQSRTRVESEWSEIDLSDESANDAPDLSAVKRQLSRRELDRKLLLYFSVASRIRACTFNILFNYMQLNSLALFLDVSWGKWLTQFVSVQATLSRIARALHLPMFGCIFPPRGQRSKGLIEMGRIWHRVLFPPISCAVLVLLVQLYKIYLRNKQRHSELEMVLSTTMILLYVLMSTIVDIFAELLRVLNCEKISSMEHPYAHFDVIDDVDVWIEDTSVQCWHGSHRVAAYAAVAGIVGCLVLLAYVIAVLRYASTRSRLMDTDFRRRYGFLCQPYRSNGFALYWEVVLTVRRMLLAALSVYSQYSSTSNAQIALMSGVVFVAAAVQNIVQPFVDGDLEDTFPDYAGSVFRCLGLDELASSWIYFNRKLNMNSLETASLYMSLSLFLTAMAINGREASDWIADFLKTTALSANGIFTAFLLYRLWFAWHYYLDAQSHLGHQEIARDQWLFKKLALRLRPTYRSIRNRIDLITSAFRRTVQLKISTVFLGQNPFVEASGEAENSRESTSGEVAPLAVEPFSPKQISS